MAGTRKDFNRSETQRHIRNTFLKLYAEKGIDGVTVNELCRNAGIVKSTFYIYFEDKYSVLEEIESELLEYLANVNSDLEKLEVTPVLMGDPLPQASKTVSFILEHLEDALLWDQREIPVLKAAGAAISQPVSKTVS